MQTKLKISIAQSHIAKFSWLFSLVENFSMRKSSMFIVASGSTEQEVNILKHVFAKKKFKTKKYENKRICSKAGSVNEFAGMAHKETDKTKLVLSKKAKCIYARGGFYRETFSIISFKTGNFHCN